MRTAGVSAALARLRHHRDACLDILGAYVAVIVGLMLSQRKTASKTKFLRRMSHDIRTPINGIRGMVDIADHFPDDPQKQAECRDKIRSASGFLLSLVNNVLDMSKLESGAIELEHKPFDLVELSRDTGAILMSQAAEHGVSVITGDKGGVKIERHLVRGRFGLRNG